MPGRFNPDDYETVADRITRFYTEHPDGRIITKDLTTKSDRADHMWRVKATIYFTIADQTQRLPKATGFAFEVDGGGGANSTAALENCETSAIGRALANAGYSGDKRPTRDEMGKADRQGPTRAAIIRPKQPTYTPEQITEAVVSVREAIADGTLTTLQQARARYVTLRQMGASQAQLDELAQRMKDLPDEAA